jgi:uncharacterized Zn-finger protein
VPIVRIGCREFKCIGDKPPQDHPHIYLNTADVSEIVCSYCSTLFRFDLSLRTYEADPADRAYGDMGELKSSNAASLVMLPAANQRHRPALSQFTIAANDPNSAGCKRHDGRTSVAVARDLPLELGE